MPHIDFASITQGVPQCPVCGNTDREPSTAPAGTISPYTRTIAEMVELEPEELLRRFPLWVCKSCTAAWHDPWFTTDFAETFYGYVCGQHFYGWAGLANWLKRKPVTFVATRSAIWQLLRDNIPGSLTYAELNCPNAGLMFAEADSRGGDEIRKVGLERLRELTRVYAKTSIFDRPSAAASAMRAREVNAQSAGFLVERTLLTEDSPYCWRRSCVQAGVGCHAYAQDFLFDRMLTLKRAEETGRRFDLVGSFVTLDHMPDPISLLKRLLTVGKRVILEVHGPGWTDLQHFYAFGNGFADQLTQLGATYRDLTAVSRAHGVPGPTNGSRFFILSTEDDLSWVPGTAAG
ncbi:MAG: hypothetical protein RLO51_03965 [Thalassobaculum sp.]|uniref:hypothetical protein n=1 Tax=Thalassobaculum sp. TaxID=2022740 RepID=UPI0032F04916